MKGLKANLGEEEYRGYLIPKKNLRSMANEKSARSYCIASGTAFGPKPKDAILPQMRLMTQG